MKLEKLETAIAEAKRFLARAAAAKKAHNIAIKPMPGYEAAALQYPVDDLHAYSPRENGALRRASMDLTRALADLRKPD